MALTPCADLSPAEWLVASEQPWQQLIDFGPSGFTAYARLRFIPDPAYPGQSENDVSRPVDLLPDIEQLRIALDLPEPAFVWPADRAWCVAKDVDPHWAGIGADPSAIDQLLAALGLDVVRADPRANQPRYY